MSAMDYKIIVAEPGISGADAVNKFTANNPKWRLYNVVPNGLGGFGFIFEMAKENTPGDSTPGGALKEAATLSENVVAFKRAA